MAEENKNKAEAEVRHDQETTWEEIGFAEFPIVTTSLRRPPVDTLEFVEELPLGPDGAQRFRTWLLVGSAEYGLPRLPDLDVFIAILKLLEQHRYERKLVLTTAKEICDIAGLTPGGTTYQRIKAALQRFAHTGYAAKNVFYHPGSKQPVLGEDWTIVSDYRLLPDAQDPSVRDGLPPSYIAVSNRFLSRLKTGQLKPVDLGLWRNLPLGLEKPIYHYLDKNLHGAKGKHEVGLRKLSQRIALTGRYDLAQLRRLYRKPLNTLVGLGFLDRFEFAAARSNDDPEKVILYPGPRARMRREKSVDGVAYQSDPKRAAEERIEPQARPSDIDSAARDLIIYFRNQFHRTAAGPIGRAELARAQEFLETCGGDVGKAKEAVAWIRRQADWIENVAGLFANNYLGRALAALAATPAPDRFDSDEKLAYQDWCRAEVHRRLAALSAEERDYLLQRALQELSAGRQGATFGAWDESVQRRIAESRVRGHIGRSLPGYDQWATSHGAASAATPT